MKERVGFVPARVRNGAKCTDPYHSKSGEGPMRLATTGNLVPVYREINADLETPVSAYLKVARGQYSFLLESVEGGEQDRAGTVLSALTPCEVIRTGPGEDLGAVDPLEPVEADAVRSIKLADVDYLDKFNGGAVGYIRVRRRPLLREAAYTGCRSAGPAGVDLHAGDHVPRYLTTCSHKIKVVSHAHLDRRSPRPRIRRPREGPYRRRDSQAQHAATTPAAEAQSSDQPTGR